MFFTYDSRGRRTSVTDQNGKTTAYAYDDADRLTSVTDTAGHATQYVYDTENNLTNITDANGHTTCFAYDTLSRVTQMTFPAGAGGRAFGLEFSGGRSFAGFEGAGFLACSLRVGNSMNWVNPDQSVFGIRVEGEDAPGPLPGVINQSPLQRIHVQLLDSLFQAPHVEVVKPPLPKPWLGLARKQRRSKSPIKEPPAIQRLS
jgi:YD repeat-containing protein